VIFLDTNVVSAMMSPVFNPVMQAFAAAYPLVDLHLPSMVLAEIRLGIKTLPPGRRRDEIGQNLEKLLQAGFAARIINFTADCAEGYATARTTRQKLGRPVTIEDALIGGMALAYGATLATRNVSDFDGYGLTTINPWAG
jgi:predicted nucleic acid-binding protein